MNYYNEVDPFAAEWLRNLIKAGHIAPGDVDTRSIEDVAPVDLRGYVQCHFFAGIGVWSYALRRAGWPDDRPVWTGSCPCQPFSTAGKGDGFADERHLWPAFFHLISQCRPPVIFGEQVASKDGLAWLDLVQTDLEAARYATAAADLCAAGVGAPHIRQRLYWVADADTGGKGVVGVGSGRVGSGESRNAWAGLGRSSGDGRLADSVLIGQQGSREVGRSSNQAQDGNRQINRTIHASACGGLADADSGQRDRIADGEGRERDGAPTGREQGDGELERGSKDRRPSPTNGHWRDADWLYCRDGKWRPVESGTFPLAHGASSRVGRLRAYGNAIVPQVAETFVRAYLEC